MKFSKRNKSAEGGRIKVLMLGPYPLPDYSPYGGVERVVITLIDPLSKFDNIDISVLSRRDDIKEDFQKVYVTLFVPKYMSKFSFIYPRGIRDAFAYDYKYDDVEVYFAKHSTLPFSRKG